MVFRDDVLETAILADNKGLAVNAIEFSAHKLFRTPDAVLVGHLVILVGEQIKVEILLFLELCQPGDGIGAHAQHHRIELVERLAAVANPASLGGTARRHGLGIKIEDHIFLAPEILEGDLFPTLISEGEGGGHVTDFGMLHHVLRWLTGDRIGFAGDFSRLPATINHPRETLTCVLTVNKALCLLVP